MSGNVGGRGSSHLLKAQTAAINAAESNRTKDSQSLRGLFTKALIQLKILNVHQAEMRGDEVTEKDVERL